MSEQGTDRWGWDDPFRCRRCGLFVESFFSTFVLFDENDGRAIQKAEHIECGLFVDETLHLKVLQSNADFYGEGIVLG